ncbi:MAG: hypothetical protein ABIB79_02285 [archaeon]
MRAILLPLVFVVLLTSMISAGLVEILIDEQPSEVYNLGDTITIPITLKAALDISGSFEMDLLCGGGDVNFYKNGVKLGYGEEKDLETSLVLTKDLIGGFRGNCKIKGVFLEDNILTEEFKISNYINVMVTSKETLFNPGESIIIEGEAIKENGETANGFVAIDIASGNDSSISEIETVNNGFFSIDLFAPGNMKAGDYSVNLNVYERNYLGENTNEGSTTHTITISQVPTSLEIMFEGEPIVEPGTDLRVKAILHDQTGESIASTATITLRNQKGELLEMIDINTDEFFIFPIHYTEPPAEWSVSAVSEGLENEVTFTIPKKEAVEVELVNRTITIRNIGNVPYNKSVLVKVGNDSVNIDVLLDVDDSRKYLLSAPDGEYEVEVVTDQGSMITGMATLTGRTVSVKESKGVISLGRPFVWVFIIFILGFVAFMIVRKGAKRSFFGYIYSRKNKEKGVPLKKKSIISTRNKAELSLSIKGDKQNVSLVCLRIKNLNEIEARKSSAEETLQNVVDLAENNKAATYQNQNSLFFILAPVKTKTFTNEKKAIDIAQKAKTLLDQHNKIAKQKIDFGLSLNYGTIVAKQEANTLMFMSMGTLITMAKKVAAHSNGEILLADKINSKVKANVKTEKNTKGELDYYTIKEVKNEDHSKFLRSFLNRMEGEKNQDKPK